VCAAIGYNPSLLSGDDWYIIVVGGVASKQQQSMPAVITAHAKSFSPFLHNVNFLQLGSRFTRKNHSMRVGRITATAFLKTILARSAHSRNPVDWMCLKSGIILQKFMNYFVNPPSDPAPSSPRNCRSFCGFISQSIFDAPGSNSFSREGGYFERPSEIELG
jgi:hypothetical protein